MQITQLDDVRDATRAYAEFLRVEHLSAGVYRLPAGAPDPQRPHAEDELYHVVAGRATFETPAGRQPVGPGTLIFVEARLEHRFVAIEEDLVVLVVFGPAETPPAARHSH